MKKENAIVGLKSQRHNSDASIPSGFRGAALGKLPQFLRAALGIVIITLGIAGLTGCGEKTPTGAFNDWRKAILAGDTAAANKLTADQEEAALINAMYVEAAKDEAFEGKILKKGSVESEEIKGDKAIIRMKGPNGATSDFVMIKVDGAWKIQHK